MDILEFGTDKSGRKAHLFILKNQNGMKVSVTEYGAHIVSLEIPGVNGRTRDVILGYDSVSGYESDQCCIGATIGRNANRIKDAVFSINGKQYHLEKNENGNNSHSGSNGYQHRFWEVLDSGKNYVTFQLLSPDKDQGFPGAFRVKLTYSLTESNQVWIRFQGVSDQDTIVNMTNHSYFNLNGHESGNILDHKLRIDADYYSPVRDESWIPTGLRSRVAGTPLDFRMEKCIGTEITSDFEQLNIAHDYNHNYILNKEGCRIRRAAEVYCEKSRIKMTLDTNLPAVQLYTAGYMENIHGKYGNIYGKQQGFCLEAQYTPNAIHTPGEEQPLLKAGNRYDKTIIYGFSWKM